MRIIKSLIALFYFLELTIISKTFFESIKIFFYIFLCIFRILNNIHAKSCIIFYRNMDFLMYFLFYKICSVINYPSTWKIHFILFSLGQERIKPFLSFLS